MLLSLAHSPITSNTTEFALLNILRYPIICPYRVGDKSLEMQFAKNTKEHQSLSLIESITTAYSWPVSRDASTAHITITHLQ